MPASVQEEVPEVEDDDGFCYEAGKVEQEYRRRRRALAQRRDRQFSADSNGFVEGVGVSSSNVVASVKVEVKTAKATAAAVAATAAPRPIPFRRRKWS